MERMISFRDLFASLPQKGWLSFHEAALLFQAAQHGTGDILEIGSYCGRSSKLLSRVILNTRRRLYCCDPFRTNFDDQQTPDRGGIIEQFADNVLSARASLQVHLCCMTEECLWDLWDKSHRLDLVFLDGCHTYEATYGALTRWAPLTRRTALHDVGAGRFPGIVGAITDYFREQKPLNRVESLAVYETQQDEE